jgi:hypothetical protein
MGGFTGREATLATCETILASQGDWLTVGLRLLVSSDIDVQPETQKPCEASVSFLRLFRAVYGIGSLALVGAVVLLQTVWKPKDGTNHILNVFASTTMLAMVLWGLYNVIKKIKSGQDLVSPKALHRVEETSRRGLLRSGWGST